MIMKPIRRNSDRFFCGYKGFSVLFLEILNRFCKLRGLIVGFLEEITEEIQYTFLKTYIKEIL